MSCDRVREALPLLPGGEDEAAVQEHCERCEKCRELLQAYEADAQLLRSLSESRQVPAGVLDGFAEAVLTRVAEQEVRAALTVHAGGRRTWVAAAAAFLLAVGLTLGLLPQQPTGTETAEDPATVIEVSPAADQPALASGGSAPLVRPEALPAPRRRIDGVPMPRRSFASEDEASVVPVDENRGRGNTGMGRIGDLQDMIERALPGLQDLFQPPRSPSEEEVSF